MTILFDRCGHTNRCRRRWCGVFCRLDGWQDGGLGCGFFFVVLHHFLEEKMDGAFALFGFAYFGAWGEDAEGGVDGDLFDGLGFGGGLGVGLDFGDFGEVEAGDLEAVEEESGAARVDVVGGDALEDLAYGGLDRGAVFG
jgi:hypothetical protein